MPVYAYKGVDARGRNIKNVAEADNAKALRLVLRREGIMATEVLEQSEAAKKNAGNVNFSRFFSRASTMDVAIATQQMAVLIRSGIPLVEALSALIDQLDQPDLKSAFTEARNQVNEGSTYADALKAHPKIFPPIYVNMVAAGEASGTLEVVLARLAEFTQNQANLKSKVQGAMAYPAIMGVVVVLIVFAMMVVVVPKVTAIFENFNQALPWYTQVLISISGVVSKYWWLIFAVIGLGIHLFRRWKSTEAGRKKWDLFLLGIPMFGNLVTLVSVSRFSRTLAVLLSSGVPVLSAMDITRKVLGNTELMRVVKEARESVREGEGIAKPLRESGRFPPMVTHMIAIGERSGQLEEMLEHVADAYDVQVDVRVTAMTSVLQPLLIVVMGVIVGSIAIAILSPLLQINDMIQ